MRKIKPKLIDLEPQYMTQGIFTYINQATGIPWTTSADVLNMIYYGNHSGMKSAAPIVRGLARKNTNGLLSQSDEQTLANNCVAMFLGSWEKEYATLTAQYDPIENYNMVEEESPAETTRTITPAETTDTRTPAETTRTITPAETTVTETPAETSVTETPAEITVTETPAETTVTETPAETTATGSNESGIFGFNSSDSVGSDTLSAETKYTTDTAGTTKTETDTAGTTKTETDTAGTTKTETDTAGTEKFEVDANEVITHTTDYAGTEKIEVDTARSLTRHGNIGVTTSQQMLQSERDLWLWNFFYDVVFPDVDKMLCLYVYKNVDMCLY